MIPRSKGAVNSDAMVSPGKTDSQERAVDVRDSPRVIDQANLETLVAPPVTAAPPVATAPPRRPFGPPMDLMTTLRLTNIGDSRAG